MRHEVTVSLAGEMVLAVGRQEVFTALALIATAATIALIIVTLRSERRLPEPAQLEQRRRPTPVADAREALELVGSALAATHDPRALMPVILRATVDATRARGGRLLDAGAESARIGVPLPEGESLSLHLGGETELQLFLPEEGFDEESRRLADWLATQAAIALENARLHHVVQHQAATDDLTGLVNRRRFMEALAAELARADRFGSAVSLALADLDDFKLVNDRHGHPVGDEYLRGFAAAIQAHVRDIDVAARLGGEEFGILLTETDLDGAVAVAERLRAFLAEHPVEVGDLVLPVSASFGVAQYVPPESPDDLLRRADSALYQAKEAGKNRVTSAVP